MRRFAVKALAALAAVSIAVAIAAWIVVRRSLPQVDGTLVVSGITAPLEIVRDADDIPHIFAASRLDALFGLGYAHAQDRLWQMEFQRRIGFGRLSEIFGAVTVPQDRFLRTVGFGRAARATWAALPGETRRAVDAYVAGVNAFLAAHHGTALPPEFSLLRVEPEPWSGPDVIVWQKMLAWDLSRNYSSELLRHDIEARVGRDRLRELMPPYAPDGLSILTARDMPWLHLTVAQAPTPAPADSYARRVFGSNAPFADAVVSGLSRGLPAVASILLANATDALGSNNWVVDGTRTASGKPLLANDPHLDAHIPSTWYLAHLSAPGFDVIGATLPGTPAITIGRNHFIAWGETNVAADVEDLYRERLDPSGRFAEFRGRLEPLTIVPETIRIRRGAAVHFDVRISRHGPLISDAINANNAALAHDPASLAREPRPAPLEPLALRWTALDPDDTTIVAVAALNQARNWTEFTAALRQFVVPSLNFVYADVDGHIGYYAPGRIPIRASGDGSEIADGASGAAEWTGWIPFDELPHTFDPPEHMIVTANNRPAPADYPHLVGVEWTEPYRAERITELLRAAPRLTPDAFAAIQRDTRSLQAEALLRPLVAHARPAGAAAAQALAILRAWNDDARGDSAAAAIFEAWYLRLTPAIVGDKLGSTVTREYAGPVERASYIARFLEHVLATPDNAWCDDTRTPAHETCDDVVSRALEEAVTDLTRRLGADMTRWRWSAIHEARFPHQGLDALGLLRPFVSRSMPAAGDWSTVDVGAADARFEQHAIPSYRQIVDLASAGDSRFLDAVGESGHPLSPHYDDFLSDWLAVRYRAMRTDRAAIDRGALGHLRLVPR